MTRYCRQFYCKERGDRFCCVTCYKRDDCAIVCLNHPSRCKLEDIDHKPIARRGKNSKLPPKDYFKRRAEDKSKINADNGHQDIGSAAAPLIPAGDHQGRTGHHDDQDGRGVPGEKNN